MAVSVLGPRVGSELICNLAKDVRIKADKIKELAKLAFATFSKGGYSVKTWKSHALNPKSADKAAVDWIFVADTLNFSFWSDNKNNKYEITYNGQTYTGYWTLCAAMNRAIEEGIPITDANYFANVTADQLRHILRSDSAQDIPLFDERLRVINEAGNVLVKEFGGSFVSCVEQSGGSCQRLLQLIVDHFPSYRDVAQYEGYTVGLYKRAQILIGDIWGCFEGHGLGAFTDIETITMFADYRIPQLLAYFGVLEYSEELMERLRSNELLSNGESQEVEIRAASIWAVELLKDELKLMNEESGGGDLIQINSVLLDFFLWDYRRQQAEEVDSIPYHRTRSIYY